MRHLTSKFIAAAGVFLTGCSSLHPVQPMQLSPEQERLIRPPRILEAEPDDPGKTLTPIPEPVGPGILSKTFTITTADSCDLEISILPRVEIDVLNQRLAMSRGAFYARTNAFLSLMSDAFINTAREKNFDEINSGPAVVNFAFINEAMNEMTRLIKLNPPDVEDGEVLYDSTLRIAGPQNPDVCPHTRMEMTIMA